MLSAVHRPRMLIRASILCAIAVVGIGGGTAQARERSLTVMTQNLYQGTEFANIRSLPATPTFTQALGATTADYATYVATRFPDRATQIAAEIAQNQPDLVGLQEVATWHRGAVNPLDPFALPNAVNEDFTQELVAALAADGVQYAPVSRRDNNFTLAFPIVTSLAPFPACCTAVGMVESGVILARRDLPPGQLKLSNPRSGTYATLGPFFSNTLDPHPPHGFQFTNSWQSIDAKVRGKSFRFITTHLDGLFPFGLASGPQATELLNGPANTSLPVIVTGDFNSGPLSDPAAYNILTGALSDTWTAAGLGSPPLTCCHLAFNDRVNDPNAVYTDNIDHIFSRGDFTVLDEHLVGDRAPVSPPANFIWPSDHAGMVATLGIGSHG